VLRELNRHLTNDAHVHRFVTMFLARFNPANSMLEYCAAGHQSLILKPNGEIEIIGPTGPPLGVMQDGLDCTVEKLPFEKGSILVELTDGILEVKNQEGEMFGNDHVIELLKQHSHHTSQELVDLIINTALDFSNEPVPIDDMTVVVLKHTK
ncbi:MAG: hypothetical protein CMJ46_09720, partial [Planctomyces sp.]|nr:hypothetical protein [Planctomyces sp.]